MLIKRTVGCHHGRVPVNTCSFRRLPCLTVLFPKKKGDRGAMTGEMQDCSVADAITKGLIHNAAEEDAAADEDDDVDVAWAALRKDAFSVPDDHPLEPRKGRKGLQHYDSLGYLPVGLGIGDEVSATLNYALADFSMAAAAKAFAAMVTNMAAKTAAEVVAGGGSIVLSLLRGYLCRVAKRRLPTQRPRRARKEACQLCVRRCGKSRT